MRDYVWGKRLDKYPIPDSPMARASTVTTSVTYHVPVTLNAACVQVGAQVSVGVHLRGEGTPLCTSDNVLGVHKGVDVDTV